MILDLLTSAYCLVIVVVNLIGGKHLQAGFALSAALCFMVEAMGKRERE